MSAWHLFLKANQSGAGGVVPSYQEFCNSKHYTSFVRFGVWCLEQAVQEYTSYVNHLLKERKPFDQWCDVRAYQEFLRDLLLRENPESALSRSLRTMQSWSEHSGHEWQRFFSEASVNTVIRYLGQGRISPWMLYNCDSAVVFLERCSEEQLAMVQSVAPIPLWRVRFLRYPDQASLIKSVLTEAGM